MKIRSKSLFNLFIFLALLASLLGSPTRAAATNASGGSVNGKFKVEVWANDTWQTAGILPFGMMFASQQVDLSSFKLTNPALIRVTHSGVTAAHIDTVTFGGQTPLKIQAASESLALTAKKLAARDYDVIDASRRSYIFTFPARGSSSLLQLVARIEPEINTGLPFRFPAANFAKEMNNASEFYSYTLNSASGTLNINGDLSAEKLGTPLFKEWSAPTSGHPSNYTYGWARNDADNLYVAIDFTPDNTMDGEKDFTAVFVKTANGVQRFKASVPEQTWGMPGFVYTSRASYQHKIYEYKIPLKQIGFNAATSDTIELAFEAYGTASLSTLTSSQNPSAVGQSVTFTVSASGTDTVAFKDNGVDIPGCGAVAVTGTGTCTTSSLSVGDHTITAVGSSNSVSMTGNPQVVVTGTCYVKAGAGGTNTGLSWTNAFLSLQSALSLAGCTEIWVAAGTYKPGTLRTDTFTLKNNVGIYGGFVGTETLRTQRNPATNVTILSGDIDNNDTNTDTNKIAETPADIQGDNSYRVVTAGSGTTNTAVLDGFTITAGNANEDYTYYGGGGLYNNEGSPTLTNLTFSGNTAQFGGGMHNFYSSPMLTNVTFSGNTATYSGGGMYNNGGSTTLTNVTFDGNSANEGGGMFNAGSPTLTNVTFSDNSAENGGGMFNNDGSPTLTNVTFSANTATNSSFFGGGGGMHNYGSSPTLKNVTFSDNTATTAGGGMYNTNGSNPTLTNVTFSNNTAATNSGGGMYNTNSGPTLKNTIIGNSTGGDCVGYVDELSANNLIEDDGLNACELTDGGNGNIIGSDPALGALASNGGYTKTFALLNGSPAINAGTNTGCPATDQRGVPRPLNGTCDIGAFESEKQWGPGFIVNAEYDTNDGSCDYYVSGLYNCTLREAINAANTISGDDTITFDDDYTITLGSQLPPVTSTIIINGSDAPNTIIQANAAANTATYRVFEVSGTGNLTLDSLTVQNGRCNGSCSTDPNKGGGIYNGGTLTVINSTFSNNSSANNGGGIYDHGSAATVTNSTFSGNSATGDGGGIYNYGSTVLTVTNSTFSGNIATGGGGIYNYGSASIILKNNILANSTASEDCVVNYPTSFNTNLIQSHINCGTPVSTADPLLGALADNGGPTQTMLPAMESPAIDAGDSAFCPSTDQRGFSRIGICEIGAVERIGTTRKTSIPANDGWTLESKEFSNIAKTMKSTGSLRVGDDAKNRQYRSLLYFDTAYIPNNAVITKAIVKIKKLDTEGDDHFPTLPALPTHGNLVADMKKGTFGLAALQLGDFSALAAPINTAGKFNPSTPPDEWYTLTLSPANFKYINLVGATQFRVRFAKDDNNDKDADFITFYGDGSGSNAPQFTIEYSVP